MGGLKRTLIPRREGRGVIPIPGALNADCIRGYYMEFWGQTPTRFIAPDFYGVDCYRGERVSDKS